MVGGDVVLRLLEGMRQRRKELIDSCFGPAAVEHETYLRVHAQVTQINEDMKRIQHSFKGEED